MRVKVELGLENDLPVEIIKISFLIKESAPINNINKIKCIKCVRFNPDTMSVPSQLITTKTIVPKCSSTLAMAATKCVKFSQVSGSRV